MAGAAGDSADGVGGGDWPFAGVGGDAFAAEYSSVFAELGWPGGLAGELPVLDLPEASAAAAAAAPPAEVTPPAAEVMAAPARSGDAAASSSSSGDGDGDGAAPRSDDRRPAAETA
jgi:hypothetical protein